MIRSWKLRCHNLAGNKCQPLFLTPSIYRLVVIDLNLPTTSDRDNTYVGTGPRACPFSIAAYCPIAGNGRPRHAGQIVRYLGHHRWRLEGRDVFQSSSEYGASRTDAYLERVRKSADRHHRPQKNSSAKE